MGDAILTTTGSVAKKIAANSVNKTRNDINALLEGGTMTVKCHVGDAIPTGDSVKFKSIHSGSESIDALSGFADDSVTTTEGDYGGLTYDMTAAGGGFGGDPIDMTGQTIAKITSTTLEIECTSYDENVYVMFEVVVVGEIPAIKDAISELETEIDTDLPTIKNKLDCVLTYDTYTANIHVGEKVPTGSSVKLLHVRGSNGEIDASTSFTSTGIATENETYIPIGTDMVKVYNWGVITNATGETITKITSETYSFECTSYDENIYAVFEVAVACLLADEKVVDLKGGTYTVKRHVSEKIPTGKKVTLVGTSAQVEHLMVSPEGVSGYIQVGQTVEESYMGLNISSIDDAGGNGCFGYNEEYWAIFEVEVDGELNNNPVIGTYVGNDEPERFIELGFTPSAVDVCSSEGLTEFSQEYEGTILRIFCGGTAVYDNANSIGYDCMYGEDYPIVKIVEDGFKVYFTTISDTVGVMSNSMGRYYFKAYKSNKFMVIE